MQEQVIQQKSCLHCQNSFDITDRDMEFYNKISPTFTGQKFQIPTPTLCPDCRQRRRLSFRNERNLYKRKCDASGKDIISIYKPSQANPSALSGTSLSQGRTNTEQQGFKVYDQKIRRSDARDPMEYERDFDFSKSFTEQFGELMREVPRTSLGIFNSENCDYTNEIIDCKSCYLIFSGVENDGCLYSHYIDYSKYCVDCDQTLYSENCYNCFCIESSYNCITSNHCKNCSFLINCSYCEGCVNCLHCYGLFNREYCINNIQYTKEQYEKLITQELEYIDNGTIKYPNLDWIMNSENCSGAYISNSKNILFSKNIQNSEDCKRCLRGAGMNDCYDCFITGVIPNSLYIECMTVGPGTQNGFSTNSWPNVKYIYYCDSCSNSSHLFGCIGLRNKSYCIFNKQYTKEEYEKTVANIITHMIETGERGEFFHPSLSPFGYNETVAQEYYPLENKGEVGKLGHNSLNTPNFLTFSEYGYHRSHYQAPSPVADKVIDGKDLPDTIDEVSDDILKSAIKCEVTGKLFRIIPQELAFYRKHHIPLPRKHPDQRHKERMELRK